MIVISTADISTYDQLSYSSICFLFLLFSILSWTNMDPVTKTKISRKKNQEIEKNWKFFTPIFNKIDVFLSTFLVYALWQVNMNIAFDECFLCFCQFKISWVIKIKIVERKTRKLSQIDRWVSNCVHRYQQRLNGTKKWTMMYLTQIIARICKPDWYGQINWYLQVEHI